MGEVGTRASSSLYACEQGSPSSQFSVVDRDWTISTLPERREGVSGIVFLLSPRIVMGKSLVVGSSWSQSELANDIRGLLLAFAVDFWNSKSSSQFSDGAKESNISWLLADRHVVRDRPVA